MSSTAMDPYNRMTAKKIPGQHCRFCGQKGLPLVKTKCCEEWICCDTAFVSRGGGRCQDEHERYSLCYSHHSDGHPGPWDSCKECKRYWKPADYKMYASHRAKF